MIKFLNIVAFLVLSSLIACKDVEKKDPGQPSAGSKDQKPITLEGIIVREVVSSGSVNTTGTVMADEEVEIKSEVSGKITRIYFAEGKSVSKGQLLIQLNDDDLVAQMKKLEVEIKLGEEKEKRQKQLLVSSAISKEEYENTFTALQLLKANANILQTEIDKTRITAPFSGTAGLKNVSTGAFITSSTVIATIQKTQPLKLEFSVPEKYNNLVHTGSKVDFTVAGISSKLEATVYAKDPKIDDVTRTSKVRATFPNPSGKVFPGSFADINIQVGEKTKAKMIPTVAYIPDLSGGRVFLCKNGEAVSTSVVTGNRTEKEIQIVEGISVGDTVLTTGILQLKPKMPVKVNIINPAL